jgi:MbtH protein
MKKRFTYLIINLIILTLPSFSESVKKDNFYKVLKNKEARYMIWSTQRVNPRGWKDTGKRGSLKTCREYIEEVWTDMRPPSIRKLPRDGGIQYKVVTNHEEQFMIWVTSRPNPKGWKDTGKRGTFKTCSEYIEEVWTDMRPLSLRKQLMKR